METKNEYKMTEIGEIPVGWEVKKLRDIVTKVIDNRGKTPPNSNFNSDYPLIEIFNFSKKKLNISLQDKQKYVSEEIHSSWFRNGHPSNNSILISTVGNVGLVGVTNIDNICIAQNIIGIDLDSENHFKFVAYYMKLEEFQNKIVGITMSAVQPSIKVPHLLNLPVALPPLKEQQKIAEILSTVDEQIDQTDQLIEKTKELKKGLMQQLLTKGIGHTEFKQTELGEIPVEWEVTKQGDIANFLNGRAYKQTEFTKSGTPIIRIQNLTGGNNYVYSDMQLEENKYVDYGDLIYAWSATFGPYIWKGSKSIYHYHIWKIEVNENLLDKYFFFYRLDQLSVEMHSQKNGSAFAHITKGGMESHLVPLPPLKEQQEIADILSSVDEDIDGYEQEKEKYEELKKGLMQQLLTGKTRVKVD